MKRIIAVLLLAFLFVTPGFQAHSMPQTDNSAPLNNEEAEILKICKWYVATVPSDDAEQCQLRRAAAAEILKYAIETQKFSIDLGSEVSSLLETGKSAESAELLGVYIAGEIIYCLGHNLSKSNDASFASSMEYVMNIYSQMGSHSIKSLNKYLKMDSAKRTEAFTKLYNKNHH